MVKTPAPKPVRRLLRQHPAWTARLPPASASEGDRGGAGRCGDSPTRGVTGENGAARGRSGRRGTSGLPGARRPAPGRPSPRCGRRIRPPRGHRAPRRPPLSWRIGAGALPTSARVNPAHLRPAPGAAAAEDAASPPRQRPDEGQPVGPDPGSCLCVCACVCE